MHACPLCRYSLDSLPRDMQLNPALDQQQYDFIWLPSEPPEDAGAEEEPPRGSCSTLPLVKVGDHGRSPVWEGQPYAKLDTSIHPPGRHSASPVRDYSRAYPDRCESHEKMNLLCPVSSVASLSGTDPVVGAYMTVIPHHHAERPAHQQHHRLHRRPALMQDPAWSCSVSTASLANTHTL